MKQTNWKRNRIWAAANYARGLFNHSPYAKSLPFGLSQSPAVEELQEGLYQSDITPLAILQPRELWLQPKWQGFCVR